mmetsp:Transcript_95218/g.188646  ORF Transcript_95218/g.188646 Transcript_95218/m.188646 type:complete len:317 (-) Transcript_95218:142-1092(-)
MCVPLWPHCSGKYQSPDLPQACANLPARFLSTAGDFRWLPVLFLCRCHHDCGFHHQPCVLADSAYPWRPCRSNEAALGLKMLHLGAHLQIHLPVPLPWLLCPSYHHHLAFPVPECHTCLQSSHGRPTLWVASYPISAQLSLHYRRHKLHDALWHNRRAVAAHKLLLQHCLPISHHNAAQPRVCCFDGWGIFSGKDYLACCSACCSAHCPCDSSGFCGICCFVCCVGHCSVLNCGPCCSNCSICLTCYSCGCSYHCSSLCSDQLSTLKSDVLLHFALKPQTPRGALSKQSCPSKHMLVQTSHALQKTVFHPPCHRTQ